MDSPKLLLDYFAHDPSQDVWDLTTSPNFDSGNLEAGVPGELKFLIANDQATFPTPYSVTSEDQNVTEGQTYELSVWGYGLAGTIHINTISDFNCSTITEQQIVL
jgi:hypothetical protein